MFWDTECHATTDRHFISKLPPPGRKQDQRDGVLCVRSAGREKTLSSGLMPVTLDSVWKVLVATTPNSISNII
jgi:hypothetical protein